MGFFLPPPPPPRFAFTPFSGGERHCIGQNFATLEAKVFIAHVFRAYRFEVNVPTFGGGLEQFFLMFKRVSVAQEGEGGGGEEEEEVVVTESM
jgi:cytochrome P450